MPDDAAATQSSQLDRFCRQYLQLEAHLDYPDGSVLREEEVQERLYLSLFAPGAVSHPPPPRYELRVLKELVARIEAAIEDWDEHVSTYMRLERLLDSSHRHMWVLGNIGRPHGRRIAADVTANS